jgi:DNA-binding NarL/FixJ family response regulator
LVEDNPADAELVRAFLEEGSASFCQLEEARRLSAALKRIVRGGIDVVLLDLWLPDSSGLATFQRFHARCNDVPVVVLSGMDQESVALEAVKMGAQDYLVKGKADGEMLVRALRFAVERAAQLTQHQAARAEVTKKLQDITENLAKLTAREMEILSQIAEGKSLKRIASISGTSYSTVRNQRASILEKMQADSSEHLVRLFLTARFGREA